MITPKILDSDNHLLLDDVPIPFEKVSKGIYRVLYPDTDVPVKINWNEYAVPQGNGFTLGLNNFLLFRRVDRTWLVLRNELAYIVNKSVKSFQAGEPTTFADLAENTRSEVPIKVAYVTGILGRRIEAKEEEKSRYKITKGWLRRVLFFNSYYKGLFLFENHNFTSLCSLLTYWWDKELVLKEDVNVEDKHVEKIIKQFSDKSVQELVNVDETLLRILCLLIGAGVMELI